MRSCAVRLELVVCFAVTGGTGIPRFIPVEKTGE
jgi:hypothetical protein